MLLFSSSECAHWADSVCLCPGPWWAQPTSASVVLLSGIGSQISKDISPHPSLGFEASMNKPCSCIFHKLGTPSLPFSDWRTQFSAVFTCVPLPPPTPSHPSHLPRSFLRLLYVHWRTFWWTDLGHVRIWHATFYIRVECGFSVLFLFPLGGIPLQILSDDPQCMDCPNVTDWVAALVGWPGDGIWRAGAPHVVGKGSVGLQGMANEKYLKYTDWKHGLPSPLHYDYKLSWKCTHSTVGMLCGTDNHNAVH